MTKTKMTKIRRGPVLVSMIIAGVSIAVFTSPAEAQISSARRAAIERCTAEAQTRWPDATNRGVQRNRTMAYKACMRSAGQRP